MVAEEVVVHNGTVHEFDVGDQGLIYGDAFALYHRQDRYQGDFAQQPIPVTGVQGIGYDASGRLFVLGWQALARQQDSGEWQKVSHSPFTQLPCDLRCGSGVWVCNTQWVSRAEGGRLKVVETGEAWESSAEWGDDGLLVGTVGGRIIGIEPAAVQVVGLPEGLVLSGKTKVEIGEQGVLLSGKRMPLHMWSEGKVSRLLGNESKIGVFLDDQHILRFPSMNAYYRSRINVKPVYHVYSSGEDLTRFELPTDAPYLQLENFTKVPGGRVLIATNRGLFEIGIDGAKLERHQTPERPFTVTAVDILRGGEVWIGDANGRFCKLEDSSDDRNWKALPGTARQQVTHFGSAKLQGRDAVLIGTKTGLYAYDESRDQCRLVDAPFKNSAYIQDIALAPHSDDVMISVRNIGVYLLREGVWAKVDLGEAVPTNMVWDIEYENDGAYWLTTSEWYARVQRRVRELFCYVDVTSNDSNEATDTEDGPFRVEKDSTFQAKLSVSNPFGQAGYRYRQSEGQWKYLAVSDGLLQLRPDSLGLQDVEVQAFDHDLNFSSSVYVPLDVFLPWWRWQIVRWGAVLFVVAALTITTYSVQQSRRSRKARVAAERETARIERERRALAERGAKERERLLLRVCHDLKNPLNVVFACTEMLGSGELAPDEAVVLLTGSAESMNYLSKQLLSYSKAKRRSIAEKSHITVEAVFDELRRESLVLDREKLRELEVQVDADMPVQLYSDAHAVKEILRNLLDNAAKHCSEGKITLRFVMRDGLPTFVVEDTGAGMPSDELDAIFDAFYQTGDVANQREGLGLGLAICKSLAETLGGQLSVQSELGRGSQFSLALSRDSMVDTSVESRPQNELSDAFAPHFAPGENNYVESDLESLEQLKSEQGVLVVDDMEYVGITVVQLLNKLGQKADYVRPGDAVEAAADASYDKILVDLNMQGVNGFNVAKELRGHRGESISIIAISENEQLIQIAEKSPEFDQAIPKTQLFGILGRCRAASY
ncbi:MAG: hypothetical protein Aurels2KO_29580 [Aureliella sp.]